MADLYTYKGPFDPVFLPGETAKIVTASKTIIVECLSVGALPYYYKDFGALTAAVWDTDNEDTNLEMNDNELSQLRMRVVDDMKLRFNNLGSTRQWRTSKTDFYLPQFPTENSEGFLKEYLHQASEFFIYEDDTPRFDFYSQNALATSRVIFSGWRFAVRETTKAAKMTIWVSGWPSGQR